MENKKRHTATQTRVEGMNLTGRAPYAKSGKPKKDEAYLARVRDLPCVICQEYGLPQQSPTTAHHVIHGRYSNRKTPDRMAIPLCDGHHQGTFDTTKVALHREPEAWKRLYGEDHDYTARTQDAILGEPSNE